jgi:hypothetical protein
MGLENGGVAADASDSSMYTWRFTIGGSEKVVKALCQEGGGGLRKEKERRRETKVKVIDHPNLRAAMRCLVFARSTSTATGEEKKRT